MRKFHYLTGIVTVATLSTALLTGCSSTGAEQAGIPVRISDSLVILVGVSANQPKAELPVQVAPIISAGIGNGAPITVIIVDGKPEAIWHTADYEISNKNPEARKRDINKVQSHLLAEVKDATASSNGSDLGTAFAIAGDQIKADKASSGTIIVVDSGLSDTGFPDMTTPGITEIKDPSTVVEFAVEHDQIRQFPVGTSIYLTGIGYGAGAQEPVSAKQRDTITEIWKQILERSGATVNVIPVPRNGEAPKTSFTARTVTPEDAPKMTINEHDDGSISADMKSDVLFQPDKWDLLPGAIPVLDELLEFIKTHQGEVLIEGFTDIGKTSVKGGLKVLSQNRADAVKSYMVDHGIAESRITAVGRGKGSATEFSPNNRHVTVTIYPPGAS